MHASHVWVTGRAVSAGKGEKKAREAVGSGGVRNRSFRKHSLRACWVDNCGERENEIWELMR
eukprot:1809221-Pleurochrysis_carterae.AAC.2